MKAFSTSNDIPAFIGEFGVTNKKESAVAHTLDVGGDERGNFQKNGSGPLGHRDRRLPPRALFGERRPGAIAAESGAFGSASSLESRPRPGARDELVSLPFSTYSRISAMTLSGIRGRSAAVLVALSCSVFSCANPGGGAGGEGGGTATGTGGSVASGSGGATAAGWRSHGGQRQHRLGRQHRLRAAGT